MFKIRYLFPFFFLLFTSNVNSQNHVTWVFSFDSTYSNIVVKGTIDKGWHLYSQKTQQNAGPIPVTVSFEKKKGLKLIGPYTEELVPHEIFDVNFDSQVYLFEDNYLAYQQIKLKSNIELTGTINYMVCDDRQCLPPIDVPFSIQIK
jgi:hypothetical protein